MKKLLIYAVAFAAAFTSCMKSESGDNGYDAPANQLNLLTTEDFEVPVKEGFTTKVAFAGEEIACTSVPMTITVPKGATVRADEDLVVSYVPGEDLGAIPAWQNWQTIAFEDTKNGGDYDYNDVVIHVKTAKNGNKVKIGIHPIALGSVRKIGLGCMIYSGTTLVEDIYIANDIRAEIFEGREGFINTFPAKAVPVYRYNNFTKIVETTVTGNDAIKVVWYIVPEGIQNDYKGNPKLGEKLFAINPFYKALDVNSRPLGLVITKTGKTYNMPDEQSGVGYNWFAYPMELQSITECYPTFENWLRGGTALDLSNADKAFPIYIEPASYDSKKDDYDVVFADCLYALPKNVSDSVR